MGKTVETLHDLTKTHEIGMYIGDYIAKEKELNFEPFNIPFMGLGVMTLWFGWLFFNAGSTLSVQSASQSNAERAMTNSMVGPSFGGLGALIANKLLGDKKQRGLKYDTMAMLNGVLCGLVAITGNCALTETWAAAVIGFTAPFLFFPACRLLSYFHIDDAAGAFPIHGPCGAWGIMMTSIFALPSQTNSVYYGIAYGNNGH